MLPTPPGRPSRSAGSSCSCPAGGERKRTPPILRAPMAPWL